MNVLERVRINPTEAYIGLNTFGHFSRMEISRLPKYFWIGLPPKKMEKMAKGELKYGAEEYVAVFMAVQNIFSKQLKEMI